MAELNIQGPGFPGASPQEKKLIGVAVAASILLHVVLAAIIWKIPLQIAPDEFILRDTSRDVELIFEAPTAETSADDPKTYVSVPDRQAAAEAPAEPDYLALHHSVAADNKMGDSDQPSADENGLFNRVEIRKEELIGAEGVQFSQQPQPENKPATSRQQSGAEGGDTVEAAGEKDDPLGAWALPEEDTKSGGETDGTSDDETNQENPELEEWWGGRENPSILKTGDAGAVGDRGFDFNQQASGSLTSGVAVIDQFQLNTVQWDWAPWIQVFANELHRHWVPPYAYGLGLIDGTTVIRLVVEKDGRPSGMDILDEDGHGSLHIASLAALKAFAPYLPLPAHFPEENLVITLSLHYPAFQR